MILKADLTASGIKELQKQLIEYKDSLLDKSEVFVKRLAEEGIKVAKANSQRLDDLGNITSLIQFTTDIEITGKGAKAIMIAMDSTLIKQAWLRFGKVVTADVSPLLMAEFGSGWKTKDSLGYGQGGQGTFPDQTHAFDKGGWSWMGLDGLWHHSSGIEPTEPMYNAYIEMQDKINTIAKEVFGDVEIH